uniref:Uncharacterized protein n=1 Tax=viral metagenome TaxID=1070528 RepID=A0A6M3JJ91_9ZZZZ
MNQGAVKEEMQVIEHVNPPWGANGIRFSANFKGVIGRGKTEEEAIAHLLYLINQNSELTEELNNAVTKASR